MGANGVVPQNDDASPLTEPEAEPEVEPKAEPEAEPEAAPRSTEREADPLSSSNNHGLENDMDMLNVSDNKPASLLDTSGEEPKPTIIDEINEYGIAEPEANDSDAEANDSDAKANDSDAEANDSDAEANEATDK